MTAHTALRSYLNRLQLIALLLGVVGLAVCYLGYVVQPVQFFRSYLMAYTFWLGVVLGCLAILMLHHLVGGAWGAVIRRSLESSIGLLPLMLVFFAPILFGLHDLYTWAQAEGLRGHETAPFRHLYLSMRFFLWRAGFYFLVWLLLAFFLNRWSCQQERAQDAERIRSRRRRLQLLSGGGLVLYGLTVTFAAIDWLMSLEPLWFSTIYGFLVITGQLVAAMAFAIVMTATLARFEPVASVTSPALFNDFGNLLFAFVLLWAYNAFSQLLITWSGDLPEEIRWYIHRSQGGWDWIRLLLLVFHFALPFFLLLSRGIKRQPQWLTAIAAGVFVAHAFDVFWLVMPAFFPKELHVHWLDIAAPVGIGGIWMTVFLWRLKRRSLLPFHDPRLQEVLQHG